MATYVPRVLICGSIEEFRKIFDKPAEIIGQIFFERTSDEVRLFLGERNLTGEDIAKLLNGTAEFLIFTDALEFYFYMRNFPLNRQVMLVDTFAKKNYGGFFSKKQFVLLESALNEKNFNRVLDFDAYLAESDFHMSTNGFHVEVDCLAEKLYPIMEDVYRKIYRSFDECKFHHFDALILSKERTPEEFIDVMIETDALTENIWAFVRKNSALEKFLAANENTFETLEYFGTTNGGWCHIKKIMPPVDVGIYVVTHKDAKLQCVIRNAQCAMEKISKPEGSILPEGYRIIHAGHSIAKKDFGYTGDDTGENISHLNPFLDEVTALYWIWKNTKHTYAGLVHYRRFFTSAADKTFAYEKILSAAEIKAFLNEYDIIVNQEGITDHPQREEIMRSIGQPGLVLITEKIIRNHLIRKQPDYLDAFDDVLNGITLFACGMFITRRNIFNTYCEWLFSFLIDATEEVRDKFQIGDKTLVEMGHYYSRVVGHFAERLLTVWLMKNHLRIKTMHEMFREDV